MPTDQLFNRLDVAKNKGIGVDLPIFGSVGSGIKLNYTTIDQAAANAKNLLLTNNGERIMQPNLGCNLYRSLFENETDSMADNIKSTIITQFDYWLPYIFINKLTVNDDIDANRVNVTLSISLVGNEVDTRSIQLEIINTQQNG